MAASDLFIGTLGTQTRSKAIPTAVQPNNAVAARKMRDLAALWSSGLNTASLATNVSDPFSDGPADMEAQLIIARQLSRQEKSVQASTMRLEIVNLVGLQSALQTSARIVSRIAALTCEFDPAQ
jgi:hypothetical protein